jgi:hypothetical protein
LKVNNEVVLSDNTRHSGYVGGGIQQDVIRALVVDTRDNNDIGFGDASCQTDDPDDRQRK